MDSGKSVITNGPLVDVFFDSEIRFDGTDKDLSQRDPKWHDQRTPAKAKDIEEAKNEDGRVGGRGSFDGGLTMLYEVDACPVIQQRWTNTVDFGGAIDHLVLTDVQQGSTASAVGTGGRLRVFMSPTVGTTKGALTAQMLPLTAHTAGGGPGVAKTAAFFLSAFTPAGLPAAAGDEFANGQYFCIANPIWTSPVTIKVLYNKDGVTTVDFPARLIEFGANSVGMDVTFDISMQTSPADNILPMIEILDGAGNSAGTPILLKNVHWYNDRHFIATNKDPLPFGSPPLYPPTIQQLKFSSFVVYLKAPQDFHGNLLNTVGKVFTMDHDSKMPITRPGGCLGFGSTPVSTRTFDVATSPPSPFPTTP